MDDRVSLFRSSFWMGILTFIKAGLTYVMWKIIAVRVGPAGIAIIEQFQNFIQVSRVSIPAGLNEGVVKYVSEYHDNESKKSDILSNVVIMHVVLCVVVLVISLTMSRELSYLVFHSAQYQKMIMLSGVSMALFVINNFGLSILNAEMEIQKYSICTLINTLFNFLFTSALIWWFGLMGGLIGFALNQTITGIFTAFLVFKSKSFKIQLFFSKINLSSIKKLARYSCIPLSAALICPLSSLFLTKCIVNILSWVDAGYWQAMLRLSTGYSIVMHMVFGFYFIPKFSSIKKNSELQSEVIKNHYQIIPFIFLCATFVFIFKKQIVVAMYSNNFLPILPLFKYQLIGDVSRACTWPLKNILMAKAMVKTCIAIEIFFSSSYVLLTILFVHFFGLIGTAMAFAANYFLFWITMIIFSILYFNSSRQDSCQNFLSVNGI